MLRGVDAIEQASFVRRPLWNDRRAEHGSFDIIGDVHSRRLELLGRLGYVIEGTVEAPQVRAPEGRRALLLGDLVDHGPDSPGVLRLAMAMTESGAALRAPGNHEVKLLKHLHGKNVRLTHGPAETVEQLAAEPAEFREQVAQFIQESTR